MAMISRMKLFRTSLQATRTKWMRWPWKESAEDAALSNDSLFDDKNRLMHIDPGRFVLFNGRWYFPPVTVRPTIELWDHSNLSLVEPKGNSVFSSVFRQRNLYVAAGVVGLGGLGGIGYYAVKYYKKRLLQP
ncbi:hypothetical protein CTI12_AA133890 [Artemisia annua]|uniref:Uncharacterized protein n=1 Tax=Artemisia annua TaxID=35608 RepID=A0A2U1PNE5_ARTAN|nr:hypothetical protein CTI12_AA133890 [Artemisia annua]